jgi:hypothetical protein
VIERSAPAELRPLREALSQLQMAYSRMVQSVPAPATPAEEQGAPAAAPPPAPAAGGAPPPAPTPAAGGAPPPSGAPEEQSGPGPAESSGRLWVPGR